MGTFLPIAAQHVSIALASASVCTDDLVVRSPVSQTM
jgi:hypothetical protein